jgi:hypothetical protein
MEYQLPRAVINVKQGAGRLIRDETDRGVLMICDPRLIIKALRQARLAKPAADEADRELADVLKFFANRNGMKRMDNRQALIKLRETAAENSISRALGVACARFFREWLNCRIFPLRRFAAMAELIAAIESVVALPAYQRSACCSRRPPSPASSRWPRAGVFFGYDFHLGETARG